MREQRADGSVITGAYTLDGLPRWDSVAGDRIYLGRQLVAQRGNGGYMHTDALGSPVARTGSALELLGRTRYEPYGATAAGTAPLRIGFAGHVSDADTALLYMQQRYYEPIAGRFLSVDPVTTDAKTGEHFNRYVYAENNPYKYADPDGQLPILLVPLALKALDAALTAADLYTAAQTGGAGAVGRVALESLAGNALPGGKILGRLVHGVGDAAKGVHPTFKPGPYAGESMPARGPGRDFNAAERAEGKRIFNETGCHTCGTKNAGTKNNDPVLDHQPVSSLNREGAAQRLYPQCLNCSRDQGLAAIKRLREEAK